MDNSDGRELVRYPDIAGSNLISVSFLSSQHKMDRCTLSVFATGLFYDD